jgi:lysophospholipase
MFKRFELIHMPDGTSIRFGEWPGCGKLLGTVVILNGRREFMEKYAEPINILNQKGYDVYSLDWRGQGRSSRLLSNRHKGFVASYKDYLDDLTVIFQHKIPLDSGRPLYLLAHSMGGHIALRFLHDFSDRIDKAVLVSPMIDIHTFPFTRGLARIITEIAMRLGVSTSYIFGGKNYGALPERFNGNPLTSDPIRFWAEHSAISKDPDLALGGVTWGWLQATFKSIDLLASPGYAEKIQTPILMVCAEKDKIVPLDAQKKICNRLNNCQFVLASKARHEILRENDTIQNFFWQAFDRFVTS